MSDPTLTLRLDHFTGGSDLTDQSNADNLRAFLARLVDRVNGLITLANEQKADFNLLRADIVALHARVGEAKTLANEVKADFNLLHADVTSAALPGGFAVALANAQEAAPRVRGVALSGVGPRPWEAAPNPEFRQRIAQAERSAEHVNDGYHLRNPSSGALGRYQFLPIALRDIGWMDAEGAWTEAAARHSMTDEAGFLATPAAQEVAMSAYLARQEAILDRGGTLAAAGATIRGLDGREITLNEGALVAAAHRRGAGTLARYLTHRTETPDAPLSPAQRTAFESIEHRLRNFAEVAYASERPGNRLMARRAGPAG